ncbi:MAG: hypothetical protein U9Q74_08205 [Gemmatimonadota bacterium]|nr:hypothetical protein [Gemmatimonadota bacterium]
MDEWGRAGHDPGLSTVYCLLSTVYCLLSTVYCLLRTCSSRGTT